MKRLILIVCAVITLAGCASYRGGTAQEEYGTQKGGQVYPEPMASPTFRPGMNPQDLRDSQFPTRPQPNQTPQP